MGDVTNTHPCHDKERAVTDLLNAALPPIPDVPFMIGLGAEHRHAVDIQTARTAADAAAGRGPHAGWTHAACGQPAVLARKVGEFRRDNPLLERAAVPVAIVNGLAGFEVTNAPDRRAAIIRGVDVNRLDAQLRVDIETRHDAGGER